MNITITQTVLKEEWRRFVEEHPQGNIFHTPEMFQVFAYAARHRPTLWAALGPDGRLLALLMPVRIALMDGLLTRLTTRAVVYGGVLCAPDNIGREALAALLEEYRQSVGSQYLFTELRNLADQGELKQILEAQGFAYEDHLNYLIDLSRPPEAIMRGIGRRTRKHIRRGLRQGQVVVEDVNQPEQVGVCYELLGQTYARARVPLAERSLFEAAFDVLHPKGMVKFLLARVGDVYAAVSVALMYKGVIYDWYGGMDRQYARYTPNEILQWYEFKWGSENGYRVMDLGGAGKPDEPYGVRCFKAKFGGQLVCYGRNTCVHAPLLMKLSQKVYRFARGFLA